jgi:AcrR family transcriptional regulator
MMSEDAGTRQQILHATYEALRDEGFAATTSRAVARRGGFNQALVFYYFGSMDALLLAALDWTNEQRLAAYRDALAEARTPADVLDAAARLFREDRDTGHITVVSQMIAGSVARPELAPQMLARMQPWLELCEKTLSRILDETPLTGIVPRDELGRAVVTFYLGANLLTHLEGDTGAAEAVIARLRDVLELLNGLVER